MLLTPKAHRFVCEAIRDLPDAGARERLRSWMHQSTTESMPPDIASLALTALERFETWMRECLEASRANEDKEAELINDIRFVQAIESDLRKAGIRAASIH